MQYPAALAVKSQRGRVHMPQYADTSGYTEAEIALWETLERLQGQPFKTRKDLSFTYSLKGNEMFISRKEKSITRSTVNMAYRRAVELMAREGSVSGPKKLQTFGASYLYPIFQAAGVITPPAGEGKTGRAGQEGQLTLY